LRQRAEFLVVAERGRKSAMPGVVVQALAVPEQRVARLGFTCSVSYTHLTLPTTERV